MSDVVHIYGTPYETCPVCGQKCVYGGETNAIANEQDQSIRLEPREL
jgi:hypothetical protein